MSNSLDPHRPGQNAGPDLGPNCIQRLSADDKFKGFNAKSKIQWFDLKLSEPEGF